MLVLLLVCLLYVVRLLVGLRLGMVGGGREILSVCLGSRLGTGILLCRSIVSSLDASVS